MEVFPIVVALRAFVLVNEVALHVGDVDDFAPGKLRSVGGKSDGIRIGPRAAGLLVEAGMSDAGTGRRVVDVAVEGHEGLDGARGTWRCGRGSARRGGTRRGGTRRARRGRAGQEEKTGGEKPESRTPCHRRDGPPHGTQLSTPGRPFSNRCIIFLGASPGGRRGNGCAP